MSRDNSDLSTLAKSAAIVFIGIIFGRLLGLIGEVYIVRILEPDVYGNLALAYTIAVSITGLLVLGIDEGVTRQLSAEDTNSSKTKIVSCGFFIVLLSSIAIVILYTSAYSILYMFGMVTTMMGYILLFTPYLAVTPLSKVSYSVLRGLKLTNPAIISRDFVSKIVSLFLLFILSYMDMNIESAIIYWTAIPFLTFLFTRYYSFRLVEDISFDLSSVSTDYMSKLWKFSWPLALSTGIFIFLSNLDILMIGYFLSSERVGQYRAVQPLKQSATFALGAFTFLFLPLATEYHSNQMEDRLDQLFTVSTKWVLILTFPPSFVMIFFSTDIVREFFGPEYAPAAPVLTILVAGLMIRAISGLNGDMVKALGRPRIELFSAVIGLCSNFILNIILIPRYGIIGASLATVVGYVVYNITELIYIYYLTSAIPLSANIVKFTVSMVLVSFAIYIFTPQTLGIEELILVGIVFTALQPLILIVSKSVDEYDLELINELEDSININLDIIKNIVRIGIK